MSNDTEPVSVTFPIEFQGITIWVGDGAPCTVDDRHSAAEVRDWISRPLQRATTVARLRAIADMLDDSNAANLLADMSRPVASP